MTTSIVEQAAPSSSSSAAVESNTVIASVSPVETAPSSSSSAAGEAAASTPVSAAAEANTKETSPKTFRAYGANPHRRFPQYCPYCGGTSLFPEERDDFAWSCTECERVFALAFLEQQPNRTHSASPSTAQALQASLQRIGNVSAEGGASSAAPAVSSAIASESENPKAGFGVETVPAAHEAQETQTERTAQDLVDLGNARFPNGTAEEILTWANENIPGRIAVTLSMENTVLAELAAQYLPRAEFVFLDTGFHFPETIEVARKVQARYPQKFHWITPTSEEVAAGERQAEEAGNGSPAGSIVQLPLHSRDTTACCHARKVLPLGRILGDFDAWVTGIRRADGPTRVATPAYGLDHAGRIKINPLITWDLPATDAYVADSNLITHPLTSQGYPSIGCAPCTAPVAPGEDPRSGRWAGSSKTECGLHL